MGATTNTGRTRSRRAQALNSIINGQSSTLFFYGATVGVGGVISVNTYDLELNGYVNMASPVGRPTHHQHRLHPVHDHSGRNLRRQPHDPPME